MTDIALVPNEGNLSFDIAMNGADLLSDAGMRTAIEISLFAAARASADDVRPNENGDLRGWCGDTYAAVAGDSTGSKLWLLARAKMTTQTLAQAQGYAQAALQWLVDDGVAASVTVTVQQLALGILGIGVTVQRPSGANVHFDFVWQAS